MENEQIKNAFSKVKRDITILYNEILTIKSELSDIKILLKESNERINPFNLSSITLNKSNFSENNSSTNNSTDLTQNQTPPQYKTLNKTVPQEIEGLKNQNLTTSIGNEGVSTDRQTDTSTDNKTLNISFSKNQNVDYNLHEASKILDSLDHLKKQIRFQFKHVTNQEMAVFSTIYQLEEQDFANVTYKQIALNLHLTESSIRDYVQRMITKGIPIKKQKINNRKILLSISPELRKIATLSTIIQLREL